MKSALFETIACPLCGYADFDVVKPARYDGDVSVETLRRSYSASSSHRLLDQVVRCRRCSMHYVNPRPAAELVIDSYAAAEDPTFVAQNPGRIRSFRKILAGVLKRYGRKDASGLRFLDIGCAGGASLVAAKSLGFDPVGVEPSRWMADFGRRTYGVHIVDGILEPGMFPAASFDFITLWDVLEHVPEPGALLRLIRDLLRPEGTFVLSYPDFQSMAGRVLGDRWPFWLSVHLLYYDRKTITRQLSDCGFVVDHMDPYWMTLELGYVIERARPYLPVVGALGKAVGALGLSHLPFTYNVGQTVVIARPAGAGGSPP
jgi:2-polyprenyl-3-methyl-5-hydroxy-6-metoxy-1,4-benzoquinol methylase